MPRTAVLADPALVDRHQPLLANAYALILNAVTGAALGVAFWLAAARNYSAVDVGRASAAVSCLLLVASVGQLNLSSAMTRFIPVAGPHAARIVTRCYLAAALATTVAAAIFLGVARGSDGLRDAIGQGPIQALWFWSAAVAWVIFTLQDSVLAAVRCSGAVAVDNGTYGALRLLLLLAYAATWPGGGLFAAWTIPLPLMIGAISIMLFGRYLPAHAAAAGDSAGPATPVDFRQVRRYAAGDYVASLVSVSLAYLVPAIVVATAGARVGGRVAICWIAASTVDLAANAFATSLTVEGAHDDRGLRAMARAITMRLSVMISLAVVVMVLAAPAALGALGPEYAADTTFMRVLAVAALGRIVVAPWFAIARVRHETPKIAGIELARAVTVLSVAALLAGELGVLGLGVGVVAGQCVAVFLAWPELRDVLWPPEGSALGGAEAGVEIGEDVVDRLDAHGQPHQVG